MSVAGQKLSAPWQTVYPGTVATGLMCLLMSEDSRDYNGATEVGCR